MSAETLVPRDVLVARFRHFALAAEEQSPLFATLAARVAEDDQLLTIAARIPEDRLPPNMLLCTVQFLLLRDYPKDPLARFYRSLTAEPAPPQEAFPDFRRFCLEHAVEILANCRHRRTSTNEVQRAAVLMPAFGLVARAGTPLQMVEVGCSAGLLLAWDRIGYDYGPLGRVHHPFAQLTLSCEASGPVPLPGILPPVQQRIGLDLAPLDPQREADAAWLRALIWPEQAARRLRLEQAIALARRHPPRIVSGDALETLPKTVAGLPKAGTLLVFHAFALAQFPPAAKQAFLELCDELGRARPLWRVGLEHGGEALAQLTLQRHGDGSPARHLAEATPHGERLRWLPDAS